MTVIGHILATGGPERGNVEVWLLGVAVDAAN